VNAGDVEYAYKQAGRLSKAALLIANALGGEPHAGTASVSSRVLPVVVRTRDTLACVIQTRTKTSGTDMDLLNPFVTNAAFSLELYLKVLLYIERKTWKSGHDIHALFRGLSPSSQDFIRGHFTASTKSRAHMDVRTRIRSSPGLEDFDWDLDALLTNASNAFVQWRYPFQGGVGWFGGFLELKEALVDRIEPHLPLTPADAAT